MSDGKWSGRSVKRACGLNSPAHTSDPVNHTHRVREKENEGREEQVETERNKTEKGEEGERGKKEGGNKNTQRM